MAKAQLEKLGPRACAYLLPTMTPTKEKTAEEKTLKRGQYVWAVAGDIDSGDGGEILGVWPCFCIVDNGDEVGVQYMADGKRGTVPRVIMLVETVDGMVVLARSVAVASDQHMEDHNENSNDNDSNNSSSGSGRSEYPSADGSSTPAKQKKFKKKASKGCKEDDSDSSDAGPPLNKKGNTQPKPKSKKVSRAPTLGLAGQTLLV